MSVKAQDIQADCTWKSTDQKSLQSAIVLEEFSESKEANDDVGDFVSFESCIQFKETMDEKTGCQVTLKLPQHLCAGISKATVACDARYIEVFGPFQEYLFTKQGEFFDEFEDMLVYVTEIMMPKPLSECSFKFSGRKDNSTLWLYGLKVSTKATAPVLTVGSGINPQNVLEMLKSSKKELPSNALLMNHMMNMSGGRFPLAGLLPFQASPRGRGPDGKKQHEDEETDSDAIKKELYEKESLMKSISGGKFPLSGFFPFPVPQRSTNSDSNRPHDGKETDIEATKKGPYERTPVRDNQKIIYKDLDELQSEKENTNLKASRLSGDCVPCPRSEKTKTSDSKEGDGSQKGLIRTAEDSNKEPESGSGTETKVNVEGSNTGVSTLNERIGEERLPMASDTETMYRRASQTDSDTCPERSGQNFSFGVSSRQTECRNGGWSSRAIDDACGHCGRTETISRLMVEMEQRLCQRIDERFDRMERMQRSMMDTFVQSLKFS